LLVLYGPTIDPLPIPSNVRSVVTYYQTNNAAWRGRAVPGAGFTGSINNVNLDKADDVTHFNIEKLDRLQNQAMGRIVALTGTGRPIPSDTPTTAAASTASPATTGTRTASTPAATSASATPAPASATPAAASTPAAHTVHRAPKPKPSQSVSTSKTVDTPASHGAY